jgi:IKI3 family
MNRCLVDNSNSNLELSQDKAEDAAEHICFLADANQLYDHALGIYDLDVALLVAQQSQKVRQFYFGLVHEISLTRLGPSRVSPIHAKSSRNAIITQKTCH